MKKILIKLFILSLLIILSIISVITFSGYSMYKSAIKEEEISKKIGDLINDEDYTTLENIADIYKDAIIATEDHRFYNHHGIDFLAVGRAIFRNVKNNDLIEGGSTITQQLAKNLYFTQNKEITRKVAEAFMARKLEKLFDKNKILELYINKSYYGDGYYNIKSASKGYFNKLPSELNRYEATLLAGLPNAPSVYSPTVNFELASQRHKQVLTYMVKYGYINERDKEEILSQTEEYRLYFKNKK